MENSNTAKLAKKLLNVMAAIDHVEKNGRNDFHRYSYVRAADMAHPIRKALIDNGVYMSSSVLSAVHDKIELKEGSSPMIHLHVAYTFTDTETGAQLTFNGYGSGADKGDKGVYKAHTGALKYALRTAFLVPDEADPEADEETDRATSTRVKSESASRADVGKLQPSASANRGHSDTGFEKKQASTLPPATDAQRKAAESVPGVTKGMPSKGSVGPRPKEVTRKMKEEIANASEAQMVVTDVTFHESKTKTKFAKVFAGSECLYCWDETLHELVRDLKGKDCSFYVIEGDGGRFKIVGVCSVDGIEYDGLNPKK